MSELNKFKNIILCPTFEDRGSTIKFIENLSKVGLADVYLVLVDDGSRCDTICVSDISETGMFGSIVKLRRNVGHQLAIAIGLQYLKSQITDDQNIVIMDTDGEDKPSDIPSLVGCLAITKSDVVVASRGERYESKSFKFCYLIYKVFFRLLTGRAINFGNFMAITSQALQTLTMSRELQLHLAATVLSTNLQLHYHQLDRGTRYIGTSKMNFLSLLRHGFRAIMVFAEDVLIRVVLCCGAVAILTILFGTIAVLLKLFGYATPGWFSLTIGVLALIFLQTGTLAMVSLLLTGVTKSHQLAEPVHHELFIEQVSYAGNKTEK